MNVIDCLAIAPYYLTLFFVPAPEMGPLDTSVAALATLADDDINKSSALERR
mgnify:CR=1 FL=1